jgi:hypothetical protein
MRGVKGRGKGGAERIEEQEQERERLMMDGLLGRTIAFSGVQILQHALGWIRQFEFVSAVKLELNVQAV